MTDVPLRPDWSLLYEGICPRHRVPLERRDDHGWCAECECGWSISPDDISVHYVLEDKPVVIPHPNHLSVEAMRITRRLPPYPL